MATTYTVKKGDTVWALSRRALEQSLGRKPTNAEIAAVVNKVSVPSGNRNLIYPGEKITIPVKTRSSGGQVPTGRSERAQAERYAGQARQGGSSTRPSTPSKPKKRRSSDAAIGLVTGALVGGAVGAAAGSRKRSTKNAAAATASGQTAAASKTADRVARLGAALSEDPAAAKGGSKGSTSGKGKAASKAAKPTKAQITSYNNARNALNSATTKEALDSVGKRIKNTSLTDNQKEALRKIYTKRANAIASGASAASAAALAPKSGSKKGGSKGQATKAKPGSAGRPKSDPARYVANYNKRIRNAKTPAELNKVKQAVKGSGALSGKDARSKLMDKIDKKSKTLKAVKSVKSATGQSTVPVMRGAAAKLATAGKGTTAGKAATAAAVLGGAAVKGVKKAAKKKKSTRKKSASRRS